MALVANTTLTKLVIADNYNICTDGAKALATLAMNTTLTALNISSRTDFGARNEESFVDTLKNNTTLLVTRLTQSLTFSQILLGKKY